MTELAPGLFHRGINRSWSGTSVGLGKLLAVGRVFILSLLGISLIDGVHSENTDSIYPCNTNIQTAIGVGDITATVVDRYGQLRRLEWSTEVLVGAEKQSVQNWQPAQSLRKGYLPIVQTVFPAEAGGLSLTAFSSEHGDTAADYLHIQTENQPVHLLLRPNTGRPEVQNNEVVVGDRVVAIFTPPESIAPTTPARGLISEGTAGLEGWGTPNIPCDLAFHNIRVGWEGKPIRYVYPADPKKVSYVYLGFIESHWSDPGQRILDINVNSQKKTLDPIKDAAKHQPIVLEFAVENAKAVEIEVVAPDNAPDKNSTLAAIWILDERADAQDVLLGRLNGKARVYVDCGSSKEEVVRPGVLISYPKGQEAWIKLPIQGGSPEENSIDARTGAAALAAAEKKWEDFLSSGAKIVLPDERLNNLYKTSLINLMLLRLHLPQESANEDIYVLRPGVTVYSDLWYRDAAYMCLALELAGYPEEAEKSLRLFHRSKPLVNGNNAWLQTANGAWNYPLYQWDGQGQAPWAMMNHFRFTRDLAWLQEVYPSLRAGGRWIRTATAKTKWSTEEPRPITWGLLPPGKGDAIGEGYVYYHNFWALKGIKEISDAARTLGKKEDLEWMEDLHRQFRTDVMRSLKMAFETVGKGDYIPGDPFSTGLRIWGSLAALYPCAILDPQDPMVTATLNTMWQRMEDAAPGEDQYVFIRRPKLWTYITTDWAQCYLLRGEMEKFRHLFKGYVRHASPTNGWIEEIFLDTRLGTGDMPHGWGAAGYILLLRNSIAMEREGVLHIAAGVHPEWLMKGPIQLEDLPTEFGNLDLSLRHQGKGKPLSVTLKVEKSPNRSGPTPVAVHLDQGGEWDSETVLLNGKPARASRGVATLEL